MGYLSYQIFASGGFDESKIEDSPQQATGNLHRKECGSFLYTVVNPAASSGECAPLNGSKGVAQGGEIDARLRCLRLSDDPSWLSPNLSPSTF
jgi:hypothetical protein